MEFIKEALDVEIEALQGEIDNHDCHLSAHGEDGCTCGEAREKLMYLRWKRAGREAARNPKFWKAHNDDYVA